MNIKPDGQDMKESEKLINDVWCAAVDAVTSNDFKNKDGEIDESKYIRYKKNVSDQAVAALSDLRANDIRKLFPEYNKVTNPNYSFIISKQDLDAQIQRLQNQSEQCSLLEQRKLLVEALIKAVGYPACVERLSHEIEKVDELLKSGDLPNAKE